MHGAGGTHDAVRSARVDVAAIVGRDEEASSAPAACEPGAEPSALALDADTRRGTP
jgi:hypothetical protein